MLHMQTPVTAVATGPSSSAPPALPVLRLGYAGLLPFVFGALLVWLVREDALPFVVEGLTAYAALIVAFLGGIHWGLGFIHGQPRLFSWAVVPALVAWVGLLMPAYAGLVVQGVMLVACYLVDRRVYPTLGLQAWLTLRFRLTAVGALCCFLGAAGT
jgi:hypothetical protein